MVAGAYSYVQKFIKHPEIHGFSKDKEIVKMLILPRVKVLCLRESEGATIGMLM